LKEGQVEVKKTSMGKIRVLSLKDLIKMKKASGRAQDILDVKALEDL
jgi:hypothetical protein